MSGISSLLHKAIGLRRIFGYGNTEHGSANMAHLIVIILLSVWC